MFAYIWRNITSDFCFLDRLITAILYDHPYEIFGIYFYFLVFRIDDHNS